MTKKIFAEGKKKQRNQSSKTRLAFEIPVFVCVCVCLVFLATLLLRCCCCSCCYAAWQSENLCRTPLKKVKHEQKKHKKLESVISHNTTHRNSNPFQSRQQINKSQYVIEIFPPLLLLNNFRRTHFCGFSFHTLRCSIMRICVCVCVCCYFWFPLWFRAALFTAPNSNSNFWASLRFHFELETENRISMCPFLYRSLSPFLTLFTAIFAQREKLRLCFEWLWSC